MEILLALATALVLGTVHALEPDHMAAVSAFVVRRPSPRAAVGFGLRWAFGHGAAVFVVGLALVLLSTQLPEAVSAGTEKVAGAVLVALGTWTYYAARRIHAHAHTHADGTAHSHLHAHEHAPPGAPADHAHRHEPHEHGHAVTLVGALHGLAGTAPVVALLPVASFDSPAVASGYLLAFGVGTAAGMAVYAMLAGWLAGHAAARSERLARAVMRGTGLLTAAVGVWWLVR